VTGARWRAAAAEDPIHVYPDGTHAGHRPTAACPCGPGLEIWTWRGIVTHRLVHRAATRPNTGTPDPHTDTP
jgi:hypothetical protein